MQWNFDFELSFNDPSPGREAREVLDSKGRKMLGSSVWEAAAEAISFLYTRLPADIVPTPASAVRDYVPAMAEEAKSLLGDMLPDLVRNATDGRISLRGTTAEKLAVDWLDYDAADRGYLFFQFADAKPLVLASAPDPMIELVQEIAAVCVILRTNALAIWNGDPSDYISQIATFRRYIHLRDQIEKSSNATEASILSKRGRDIANRRHQGANEIREWVQNEWMKYRDQYAGNKSDFARHYAARVMREKGVKITDRQIRDVWLKDDRPASRPDGMPADGA